MKILFITSSRIGDAVLSTGILNYISQNYPSAKVTIVCGALAASLFEGYPQLERLIPLNKQSFNRHWIKLWPKIAPQLWDMVIDLRNSAVSRLILAKKPHTFGPHIDKTRHKVEQCAAVMSLDIVPDPRLWFSIEQQRYALDHIPSGSPVLAVGPAANWAAKTWPINRFIDVVEWLTAPGGLMPRARVAVFAAPGEEEVAYKLLRTVPRERQIDMIAKTDPGTAAACLARCQFYLGNDSGLMHCAAAAGVPTLGLFGPSYPEIYKPWGKHAAYIQTPESFDELIAYQGYDPKTAPCLMDGLKTQDVKDKLGDLFV